MSHGKFPWKHQETSWYQVFILLNWKLLPLDATGPTNPLLEDDPVLPAVDEGEGADWAAALARCIGGRFRFGLVVRRRCFRSLYSTLLMTIKQRPSLLWYTSPTSRGIFRRLHTPGRGSDLPNVPRQLDQQEVLVASTFKYRT